MIFMINQDELIIYDFLQSSVVESNYFGKQIVLLSICKMGEDYKNTALTDKIIGAFYIVYNKLGYGFLEKVYENALIIELKKSGLNVKRQSPVKVYYNGEEVGSYFADIIVEDLVIVELKACDGYIDEHVAQLTNYLKASKVEVGLLLNFRIKAQVKRRVFNNEYKTLQ